MKLSDVVGNAGLAMYAEIALTLFLIAFALVALRLLFTKREKYDAAARLPLDDGDPPFNISSEPQDPKYPKSSEASGLQK